jgi:HEAT repeat protein
VWFSIAFNFSVQEGVGYNLARRLVAAMGTRILIAFLLTMTGLWAQPDKTAWDLLNKGMLDKSVEKRRLAITAIASVGLNDEAVRLLELALHDQDPSIRQMGAAALGEISAKQSIPALKTALEDSNNEVAFTAAKALWQLGDRSGRVVIEDVFTGTRKNFTVDQRTAAAVLLGEDCDAATLRLMEQMVVDAKNWTTKAAAAKGLGRCGKRDAIPKLELDLSDANDAVRFLAAAAIIRLSH